MKISKTAVLVLGGIFATLGLGLMVVNAAEKTLTMDLKNAVQHFKTVRLITTSDNSGVELNRIDGPLVEISGANNFIITTGGTEESQINQILNVRNSSILGGKGNKINNGGGGGNYDVILGGEGNLMDGSDKNFYNVILGGKGNQIHNSRHSVILGGEGNIINSNSSYDTAIGNKNTLGGSYSVAIGYKNTMSSSYSAAVGSNGTVGGARSFLWTNDTLSVGGGDVFVVNGENGMVVNANKAHSFAKLTVGGSLVIGTKDISAGEGGMIKVLNGTNGRKCFCSHNGSGRNSLHGGGSCAPICNGTQKNPKCAATADVTCNGKVFNVENGCEIGSVVAGTGAFFIDNGNYIHWACESENGNVTTSLNPSVDCKQKIPDGQCGTSKPEAKCGTERNTCSKGDLYTEITKPDDENYWYWYCKYGAESIKECKAAKAKRPATCIAPSLAAGTWEWVNSTFTQVNVGGEWIPSSKSAQYSTNSSVECSFKCKEPNYSWNGSSCVSAGFSCQGPVPANATLIPGSDKNLTRNENRRLYLSVAAAGSNKCAYVCNDTHEFKNGVCVKKSYECAKTLENKYKCLHNGIYVDGTNTSHANNEYMWFCNNGTTKCGICDDGTKAEPPHSGACSESTYSCQGTTPPDPNSHFYTGSDQNLKESKTWAVYSYKDAQNGAKCAYVCNDGYAAYDGKCYPCSKGTWSKTNPDWCELDVTCPTNYRWNNTQWKCLYEGSCKLSDGRVNNRVPSNALQTWEQVMPLGTSDGYLKCYDSRNWKSITLNSCEFQCPSGTYCTYLDYVVDCRKPYCDSNGGYGDSNIYIKGGTPSITNPNLNKQYLFMSPKFKDVKTRQEFDNFVALNPDGCWYWCPEENRYDYCGTTLPFCYTEEEVAKLKAQSCGKCTSPDVAYVGYADYYEGTPEGDVKYTFYDSREDFLAAKSEGKACIVSCQEGATVNKGGAVVARGAGVDSVKYEEGNYYDCRKKCGAGEVYSYQSRCHKCPEGTIPNLDKSTWAYNQPIQCVEYSCPSGYSLDKTTYNSCVSSVTEGSCSEGGVYIKSLKKCVICLDKTKTPDPTTGECK